MVLSKLEDTQRSLLKGWVLVWIRNMVCTTEDNVRAVMDRMLKSGGYFLFRSTDKSIRYILHCWGSKPKGMHYFLRYCMAENIDRVLEGTAYHLKYCSTENNDCVLDSESSSSEKLQVSTDVHNIFEDEFPGCEDFSQLVELINQCLARKICRCGDYFIEDGGEICLYCELVKPDPE